MSSFLKNFIQKFKTKANCPEKEKCLEIMSLVIDGEADYEQKKYVQDHVKSCMPCNHEYEVDIVIKEMLQAKCTGVAPDGLVEAIKNKIN